MITENRQYLNPKLVYIPLTDQTSKIASVKVEIGDTVQTGQPIAVKFKGKVKTPVISTVSGVVTAFEERLDRFGKTVDHIVIENDLKGLTVSLEKYTGDVPSGVIRNRLLECGISQVSIDGLYTPITFETPIKHILVNAVYINEPFISTEYEYIKNSAEEIAEGIALLGKAAYAETMTLIVDNFMDAEALENLGKATVDKGIEVVVINSKKVNGGDFKVAKKIVGDTLNINLLENEMIYTSVCAAKYVYDAVRGGLPLTKRQVAITGDGFRSNAIYDIRIGTPFSDIAEDMGGYTETSNLNLHIGSFLTGTQIQNDQFSITSTVDTINVGVIRDEEEDVCIKCGECNDICPAGILPQNIMDAELRNVNSRIVELNTNECVECGLCTYVCPSKINVLEWVRRAKRRVG